MWKYSQKNLYTRRKIYLDAHDSAESSRAGVHLAQKTSCLCTTVVKPLHSHNEQKSLWEIQRIKIVFLLCFFIAENACTFF